MAPQPVKPATSRLEMKPLLLGNRLDMWNCDRWNVMPARPRMTAPGARALKSCELEQASRISASTFKKVPAWHEEAGSCPHAWCIPVAFRFAACPP